MAAHRYWRITLLSTYVGGSYWVPGKVELRSIADGLNKAYPGAGTATSNNTQYGAPIDAFDSTTATAWASRPAYDGPPYLQWDFGAGIEHDIAVLFITSTSSGQDLATGTFSYSDNGADWTTLLNLTGGPSGGASKSFAGPGVGWVAAAMPLPTVLASGGGLANISTPRAVTTGFTGARSAMATPGAEVFAGGGANISISLRTLTLTSVGHDSTGENAIQCVAPTMRMSAWSGASCATALIKPTLSAAGTVAGWAQVSAVAPLAKVTASGTVSGTATAALSARSPNLVGYGGAVCSVSVTGSPTMQATGTTGGIGGAQVTCPLFRLSASATAQNHGSASLLSPSPRLGQTAQAWLVAPSAQLTAIGSAAITATYEAYAVNLKHTARPGVEPVDEATRYTNFPFTHVIRHKGCYYGANSTGLYLLEGTTDDTAPITWSVKTAMTDFKSPQRKTVASAYFGGRLGPADTITLHAGEGAQTQPYSYTTPRGALAQNYRQAFGKGIKQHRYYALAASGSGEMALDNIDLDVHNLTRRI